MKTYIKQLLAKYQAYQKRQRLLNEKLDQLTDPTFIERALKD